jgi:hypothetical protein
MKFCKLLGVATAALFASALLIALVSAAAQAQDLKWHQIFGIPDAFNVVGVGAVSPGRGAVTGAVPWVTTSGHADVNLITGKVDFRVNGLVLAVGSAPSAMPPLSGLGIGTNAGVTMVKGTLVCNVSGTSGPSSSVEDDTDAVPLSLQGDTSFQGKLLFFPATVCTDHPDDVAFLIRIVTPAGFANLWIAAGGVLTVDGH